MTALWIVVLCGAAALWGICSVLTWGWMLALAHEYSPGVLRPARYIAGAFALFGPVGLFLITWSERAYGSWPWEHGWRWK